MNHKDLQNILHAGEDSQRQFKQEISHTDSLAAERVAMSNSGGGQIFIGVNDKGQPSGLQPEHIRLFNQQLSNVATNNVRPPINPATQNIATGQGLVMVVTITDGLNKPYMDLYGQQGQGVGEKRGRQASCHLTGGNTAHVP